MFAYSPLYIYAYVSILSPLFSKVMELMKSLHGCVPSTKSVWAGVHMAFVHRSMEEYVFEAPMSRIVHPS